MTLKTFLTNKFGVAPEGATHIDVEAPEYLKLIGDNDWWYWHVSGGSCVGFTGVWKKDATVNCRSDVTKRYIKLEV